MEKGTNLSFSKEMENKMVKVIKHPLIEIKLTKMRDKNTDHNLFKQRLNEIASLMVYEIFRDYKGKPKDVVTPVEVTAHGLDFDSDIVIVPILRAGIGMVDGITSIITTARVGHIGMYRDEQTYEPHTYFYKIPAVSKDSYIIVVDPMLATGNSAIDAINHLKKDGFTNIKLVCLVGSPEGVAAVEKACPEVDVYLAAIDKGLNENKYIVPGLGDAGDRIFGTK